MTQAGFQYKIIAEIVKAAEWYLNAHLFVKACIDQHDRSKFTDPENAAEAVAIFREDVTVKRRTGNIGLAIPFFCSVLKMDLFCHFQNKLVKSHT